MASPTAIITTKASVLAYDDQASASGQKDWSKVPLTSEAYVEARVRSKRKVAGKERVTVISGSTCLIETTASTTDIATIVNGRSHRTGRTL